MDQESLPEEHEFGCPGLMTRRRRAEECREDPGMDGEGEACPRGSLH